MSLRRVRCPRCSRRYDVTGVVSGTRLRCGGCTTVLRVPAWPAPRRLPLLRIAAGSAAGLLAVAVLGLALRPPAPLPDSPAIPFAAVPAAAPSETRDDPGFVDDAPGRIQRELQLEFPASTFAFSLRSRPFFIALESSDGLAGGGGIDEIGQALDLASMVFRREIGDRLGLRPVRESLLPVVVLQSRAGFDRYCEKARRSHGPDVKGFYEYSRERIVTYQDDVLPRDVLLHEATHQFVHHYVQQATQGRKAAVTYWMQEGLGCYVEPFRLRVDGEVGPDRRLDHQRLPMLKQVLQRPDRAEYLPLARLLSITVDGMFDSYGQDRADRGADADREAKFCYAESWALVHFLRQSGPGHRRVFDAYLRRELAGAASRGLFEQLVRNELGLELPQFEEEFVRYVLALR